MNLSKSHRTEVNINQFLYPEASRIEELPKNVIVLL